MLQFQPALSWLYPDDGESGIDGLMVGGKMYRGKELMDFIDTQVKNAYFLPEDAPEKEACRDFMWYLWNGAKSPVFGKDKNRSFEHYFIEDPEVMRETMNRITSQ